MAQIYRENTKMNNWLSLTPEQVNAIKLQVSSFDEDEVRYKGLHYQDSEIIGGQKVYDCGIEWLEVKIGDEWHTLIDNRKILWIAIFRLTDSQYSEITEALKNTYYD